MSNVTVFTDTNFQAEVVDSKQPVLVDFWAPWCGPCRMIAPMIEELASEYSGSVKIGKLNVDDSPQASQNYGVMNIPTLLMFKGGEVVRKFVGIQQKNVLQEALDEVQV